MTKQDAFKIIEDIFQYMEYHNNIIEQFYDFIEEDEENLNEAYEKVYSEFWDIVEKALLFKNPT
jgi:hypothetical protein